ncbi:MAG: hypothetical protein OXD01_02885 [Gammaproteobacteria bacterium]|nr:hypothetical protein [Gammaproteobacteria bacterium]
MLECMEAVRQHSTPDNPWVAVPIEATVLDSVADVIKNHDAGNQSGD